MRKIENLPMVLLCLFTGKLLILNSWSFESALVLLSLAAVAGLFQLKAKNDQIAELQKDISVHSKQFEDMKKEMEQLRSHVSGLKIGQSMKPAARGF